MFAITASPTWFAKSDDFKKIGKKIQKQRKTEVDKIKDKIGDIARDERKRVQEMFKECSRFRVCHGQSIELHILSCIALCFMYVIPLCHAWYTSSLQGRAQGSTAGGGVTGCLCLK